MFELIVFQGVSGLIFLFWLFHAFDFISGVLFRLPRVREEETLPPSSLPSVSIIFAARNEAARVGLAAASMLNQQYPDYEVIAVNDRSQDRTKEILFSLQSPRLRILDIEELPAGWLGKNHALYQASLAARGEWLLFTDADVVFDPLALLTAIRVIQARFVDHLVLFPRLETMGWVEKIFIQAFTLCFFRKYRPWKARDQNASCYIGIGAFNMIKRSAYEAIGTHQALKMQVLDDMELGRLVKQKGLRQFAGFGGELCSVRWVEGWKGIFKSIEKNAFAGLGFSFAFLIWITSAALLIDVLPFFFCFFSGLSREFLSGSLVLTAAVYLASAKANPQAPLLFPFHPFSMLFLLLVIWRASLRALHKGGIHWRGTFYPSKSLKPGPS